MISLQKKQKRIVLRATPGVHSSGLRDFRHHGRDCVRVFLLRIDHLVGSRHHSSIGGVGLGVDVVSAHRMRVDKHAVVELV